MITVGFQLVSIDPTEVRGLGSNGIGDIPMKDGASLADAMRTIGLPAEQPFMTLVNGEPVALENRAARALADGDQIVVFPPIEGG